MMKAVAALWVGLTLLATSQPAQCQENELPTQTRSWYGYQILLADGLAFATALGSLDSNSAPGLFAGLGSYLVASPVIHGLNHQQKNLGVSILLRLALPLTGFALGEGRANCHEGDDTSFCKFSAGLVGMGLGMIAATVTDSFLAWKSAPAATPNAGPAPLQRTAPPQPRTHFSMSSVGVVPTPNGASLVLSGSF